MKHIKLTALFFLVQMANLFAQDIELKEKQTDIAGKISFSKPAVALAASLENEQALLKSILGKGSPLQIQLLRTNKSGIGNHNYYGFVLYGIPIVGADYVIHSSKGVIDFANGNIPLLPTTINAKAGIGSNDAQISLNQKLIEEYKTYKNISFDYSDKGIVWFYIAKNLSLCYRIETKGKNILLHRNYFMDANTGRQLGFENFICTENGGNMPPNAVGTAQTLYSGTQNITTDANYNGGYRLREVRNGINIFTKNANHQYVETTIASTATDFFDNDNNWQAVEHSGDVQAHDAHWATEQIFDYWLTQQNRNSIDGNGMQINSYVHVNTTDFYGNPINMDNAYWDGGPYGTHSMFYGDGLSIFHPVVALDVCAHEIGHGINEYTANVGTIAYTEGYSMNEGFSDIWGATIEHWAAPNKQTWLLGEEIMANGFSCLRSLSHPKTEGYLYPNSTEGHYPDTYGGANWDSNNSDPHINATVLGHWYYLLITGGSGTNDFGSTFNVTGIGFAEAANIVYIAQRDYLNSNADFAMVRNMTIQVATNLYGACSAELESVTRAWYAVGVGGDWVPPLINSVSVSNYFHYEPSTGPIHFVATWQPSNVIPTEIDWYDMVTQQIVQVNPGTVNHFDCSPVCPRSSSTFTQCMYAVVKTACNTSIQSNYSSGKYTCSTGSWNDNSFAGCNSPLLYKTVNESGSIDVGIKVYPNPTTANITVSLNAVTEDGLSKTGNISAASIKEIRVIDKMGIVKKTHQFNNSLNSQTISLVGLPADVYTVMVFDGIKWRSTKVIVLE